MAAISGQGIDAINHLLTALPISALGDGPSEGGKRMQLDLHRFQKDVCLATPIDGMVICKEYLFFLLKGFGKSLTL